MVVLHTITSRNQAIEKVVKGKTYGYERVLYYNPKRKNMSYHYRYVGRKENGETRKIRSVLPRRSLIHGPFIPVMCNRQLIFVHFRRNKSDPDRRFNSDPFPHV